MGDQCQVDIEFTQKYRSRLPQVIGEIVESCTKERAIAHYDTIMIPSKESVIEILEELKDVLFPGYFRQQEIHAFSLSYHIGNVVNRLFEKLATQIARSIRHECRRLDNPCTHCLERGQKEALDFLKKIPALRGNSGWRRAGCLRRRSSRQKLGRDHLQLSLHPGRYGLPHGP